MKSYYVYKNWFVRLVICILFLISTGVFMLIEQMKKIPLFLYIILLSICFIFALTMIILVMLNKEKFMAKIYLYDDYFEIKYKLKVLQKVNIKEIEKIKLRKEDSETLLVIEYNEDNRIKNVEIEYNKNIVLYFKKRNKEIIKEKIY